MIDATLHTLTATAVAISYLLLGVVGLGAALVLVGIVRSLRRDG